MLQERLVADAMPTGIHLLPGSLELVALPGRYLMWQLSGEPGKLRTKPPGVGEAATSMKVAVVINTWTRKGVDELHTLTFPYL